MSDSYTNSCEQPRPAQIRAIRPTRRSVSGIYPFRGESSIPFESTLERDFLMRIEFFRHVLDVIPQPVEIPFTAPNGRTYTYTPDFLVYYRLGDRSYEDYPKPLLVEVKPAEQWRRRWRDWLPKWKAARRHAHEQGWVFHLFDESRIRDQVLANVQFLSRYKRMQFPVEETAAVLDTVQQMGWATIDHLLARHFPGQIYRAQGIALIWHLLATRQLDCDISQPLLWSTESTELWMPSDDG